MCSIGAIILIFLCVQSLMVAKAKEELEQEILVKEEEKQRYLAERAPPLNTSGLSLQQLQVSFSSNSLNPLTSEQQVKEKYLSFFKLSN